MKLLTSIITKSLLAVLIGMGLLASEVQAQDSPTITVTVPFAFFTNSQNNFAAGTYEMKLLSEWLLSIRNLNGGGEKMFIVRPEQTGSSGSHGCLIFDRFNGRSYLAEIYLTDSEVHTELIHRYRTRTTKAKTCASRDSENNSANIDRQKTAGQRSLPASNSSNMGKYELSSAQ